MDAPQKLVEVLAHSEMFHLYERAYAGAIGMPLVLRPVESWQLPFHGKRGENSFCAQMAVQSHTCGACLRLQATLAEAATHKPATRACIYGLCETAVPVKLGPQTIGFLQTGQVMRRKPNAASFLRAVAQARKNGADITNEETKRAYFATPVITPKKLVSVTNLLAIFADHLSMKANQLTLQSASAEAPVITKAKEFIREHYREHLSLHQVSKVVNTSRFYFSKQFRLATGLSFTGFISRTRIEKAKNLLLNPYLRVSEIAFECGFQSLTHFNRAFKNIQGQSPTEYRGTLTGTT